MSERQGAHARRVVKQFRELLDAAARQAVGDQHFDELALLVESAIDSAVLEATESIADKIDAVAHEVRRYAERFDPQHLD